MRHLESRLFKHILESHPEFASSVGFAGYEDKGEIFSLGELERQMVSIERGGGGGETNIVFVMYKNSCEILGLVETNFRWQV